MVSHQKEEIKMIIFLIIYSESNILYFRYITSNSVKKKNHKGQMKCEKGRQLNELQA